MESAPGWRTTGSVLLAMAFQLVEENHACALRWARREDGARRGRIECDVGQEWIVMKRNVAKYQRWEKSPRGKRKDGYR